ncbi:MAG: hypothetical protein H6698_05815 [Myxococcales bacterium]|nr:hypothetical protein [Myxococcales bacterium]
METLEKHIRSAQTRMVLSLAVFGIFLIVGVMATVSGLGSADPLTVLLGLLVVSIAILPRAPGPRKWPVGNTPEVQDRIDLIRDQLRQIQHRATLIRVGYLLSAIVVIFLLPRLGI